jgi:hypothetical protein
VTRTPTLRLAAALAAVLALGPLAPGGPAARAAEEGPRWVRTLRKARELAKERGHPILLWCLSSDEGSDKQDQATFTSPEVRKAMTGFLVLFGSPVTNHAVDGTLDGKPAKVCRLAPGMTCDDHKQVIDDVYRTYADVAVDKASNLRTPLHFAVDGDGKLLGQVNKGTLQAGFDPVGVPEMVKGLKGILEKAGGPGIGDEEYAKFQAALASARTSIEANRMSEGAKALAPVVALKKRITLVDDARALLARADKVATAALAKAQALHREDPLAGLLALDAVAADFPGTESGETARKAAEALKATPEGKKALKDLAREKEGRAELEKAEEAAGGRKDDAKYLRLLDAFAKKYAGLPVAAEAERRAVAVRSDPERAKALEAAAAERDARAALTAAKGLLDAGKKEEGRKALEACAAKWPGTKAAEEAKRLLEATK